MIILTAEQADEVRGVSPYNAQAAIDPIPLKSGDFMLSPNVLEDPAHEDIKAFMAALPQKEVPKPDIYNEDELHLIANLPSWQIQR